MSMRMSIFFCFFVIAFLLSCIRTAVPPAAGAGAISRPGASAFFVSDGPISSNSGRNGGKNAGRNCVSALPQRAIPGSDLLRILAGIAFCRRCRSKGLRVRSPARRLPRPLAPATVGVFRSYRRTSQAFPSSGAPPKAFPLEVRGVEWRTPVSLPLEGFAVLNDTPVACQIREPTDPQGDRCSHIPAASAATYPLRCFAPQWARFDNRHSISAPAPTLAPRQRQRRKRYKQSPEPTMLPTALHARVHTAKSA